MPSNTRLFMIRGNGGLIPAECNGRLRLMIGLGYKGLGPLEFRVYQKAQELGWRKVGYRK